MDDEELYLSLIKTYISGNRIIAARAAFQFWGATEALTRGAGMKGIDLVIMDIELGEASDGLDLIKKWRGLGMDAVVCLHSNQGRFLTSAGSTLAETELFLPKPLTEENLIVLLAQVTRARMQEGSVIPERNNPG